MHRELRARLGTPKRPSPIPAASTTIDEPDVQPLDVLAAQLIPKRTTRNATAVDATRTLLGLDAPTQGSGGWSSQTDVAEAVSVTRGRVGQIVVQMRERWRRLPSVTRLREELIGQLERLGGVADAGELERLVAAERGTGDPERDAMLARAAVRAAVETEVAMEEPRLTLRRIRSGDRVLIASAGRSAAERQRAVEYGVRLGAIADELAGTAETLPSPAEVAERLRAARAPDSVQLSQERLVQLAAAASERAAVSARLELYPRGMSATRALQLARGAVLGGERISEEDVRRRIVARFPDAEPLPPRPELDTLLNDAGLNLRFDDIAAEYVGPQRLALTGATSYASPLDRLATAHSPLPAPREDPDTVEAERSEQRLAASLSDGGILTLMVYPHDLAEAARDLRRFEVTPTDVDASSSSSCTRRPSTPMFAGISSCAPTRPTHQAWTGPG